jgi:hypothetical protein
MAASAIALPATPVQIAKPLNALLR